MKRRALGERKDATMKAGNLSQTNQLKEPSPRQQQINNPDDIPTFPSPPLSITP
jgi:hypothetical protein